MLHRQLLPSREQLAQIVIPAHSFGFGQFFVIILAKQSSCICIVSFCTQETDAMTAAIKEMGEEFPALLEPLLYERDLYMIMSLRSHQK